MRPRTNPHHHPTGSQRMPGHRTPRAFAQRANEIVAAGRRACGREFHVTGKPEQIFRGGRVDDFHMVLQSPLLLRTLNHAKLVDASIACRMARPVSKETKGTDHCHAQHDQDEVHDDQLLRVRKLVCAEPVKNVHAITTNAPETNRSAALSARQWCICRPADTLEPA